MFKLIIQDFYKSDIEMYLNLFELKSFLIKICGFILNIGKIGSTWIYYQYHNIPLMQTLVARIYSVYLGTQNQECTKNVSNWSLLHCCWWLFCIRKQNHFDLLTVAISDLVMGIVCQKLCCELRWQGRIHENWKFHFLKPWNKIRKITIKLKIHLFNIVLSFISI